MRETGLDEAYRELQSLEGEVEESREQLERFSQRFSQLKSLVRDARGGELPHKQAVRSASKALAAEIQGDYERGLLGDEDLESLDPVFASLKYADLDGAEESLERASERAGLLDDYGEARELYGREYRNLVRELDGLRRDLDEVESNLHELMEIGEVDEAVEELSRFESAVETYNEAVSDDLRSFLERDFSELVDVLLHADYFPEARAPKPSNRSAARELADMDGLTIYEVLELEGYSDSKLEHVVDNPGRVRELLEENVVWLREVSRLPGGEFLKMRVEAPATALNRAATVKRLLPRVDGPIGELREVERVARAVDDSVLELRELSGRIGVAFDRLEAHLSGRAEELSRRVGELESYLDGFRAPGDFRAS